jgi:hypothetical protein
MPVPSGTASDKRKAPEAPVINEEADRLLGRLTVRWIIVWFVLLTVLFLVGSFESGLHKNHKTLDPISLLTMLIFLIVFYAGNGQIYSTRLKIGRELVGRREWAQAVAALLPFDAFGQRMLDRSGEAHYLLSLAYAGLKKSDKADQCRQFVLKHRKGEWSVKLGGAPIASRDKPAPTSPDPANRPRPPKTGPKRRF